MANNGWSDLGPEALLAAVAILESGGGVSCLGPHAVIHIRPSKQKYEVDFVCIARRGHRCTPANLAAARQWAHDNIPALCTAWKNLAKA